MCCLGNGHARNNGKAVFSLRSVPRKCFLCSLYQGYITRTPADSQLVGRVGKASSKITELKQFSLLIEMTDPTSHQRGQPTSIKE
jgi:hypothetical protein